MADRPREDTIFCHECMHSWPRSEHGLACPQCGSEFVEFIEEEEPPVREPSPPPQHHRPFLAGWDFPQDGFQELSNGNVTRHQYRSGNGRFTFTSTTFRSPTRGPNGDPGSLPRQPPPPPGFPPADPLGPLFSNFQAVLQGVTDTYNQRERGARSPEVEPLDPMGEMPRNRRHHEEDLDPLASVDDILRVLQRDFANRNPRPRDVNGRITPGFMAPNPLAIVAQIMGMGRHGDAVYSQEELDRVISELIDQNMGSNAPGPASQESIRALPKVKMNKSMMGNEGKAECSICMDNVDLEVEVTVLPCKHWFHETCISAWLGEHDTCPHCRRGITEPSEDSGRSRQSSASGSTSGVPGSRSNPYVVPESPPVRDRMAGRPNNSRHSSTGSNGGISGWVRSHFGGSSS